MTIEPQYEATDSDESDAGIRHKRIGINESRRNKMRHGSIVEPKNVPRRQRKGEKPVCRVGGGDCGNGPEEKIRPRDMSGELQGNPEDARSREQPQERQARQIAIDTDASVNWFVQCIGG